jgi:hypothetical protein
MVKGGKMNTDNELYLNRNVFIIIGVINPEIVKTKITAIKVYSDGTYTYYYNDYDYFLKEEVGKNVFLNEKDAKKELLSRLDKILKNELDYIRILKDKIKNLKEDLGGRNERNKKNK